MAAREPGPQLGGATPAPRVLHLLAPAHFGGLEDVVHALASMRHRLGRPTGVAAVLDRRDPDLPLLRSLEQLGVPVFAVVVPARSYLRERELLRGILKHFTPVVLHTHGHRSDVMGAALRVGTGLHLVSTVHGFVFTSFRGRIYHWIQRLSYHAFDRVVTVSDLQRRQLLRTLIPPRRISLIPNVSTRTSVLLSREEARQLLRIPSEEFVIGWVGRLNREKGADILLQALARLSDSSTTASIIGDGRERSALEHLAKVLHVDGRVRWHGFQRDAGRLFRAFDLFVLSSRTEGIPLVLLEARRAGLPIVATSVGGVPDVLSVETGTLVAPNDPDGLAAAILAVRSDPTAAEGKARAGLVQAESGETPEAWLERYEQVYREIVAGRANVAPAISRGS